MGTEPFAHDFLSATSSSRSDDVTLSACMYACHLIFFLQFCTFAPLYPCTLQVVGWVVVVDGVRWWWGVLEGGVGGGGGLSGGGLSGG